MRFSWLRNVWKFRWPLFCFASVAVLLTLPLVGLVIDDKFAASIATTWGSALGAGVAVAGALWVADRQASTQRRKAAALVHSMFVPIAYPLHHLHLVLGPPDGDAGMAGIQPDELSAGRWQHIAELGQHITQAHEEFNTRIHRLEAMLHFLDPHDMESVLRLESYIRISVQQGIAELIAFGTNVGLGEDPQRPTFHQRFMILVYYTRVKTELDKLRAAANIPPFPYAGVFQ